MDIKGLDHLNLSVANLEHTVDWYRRVFNFAVVEHELDEVGRPWAILRSRAGEGETMLCVYQRDGYEYKNADRMDEIKVHRMAHFSLRIEDPDEWAGTVAREGVELTYEWEYPYSYSWYVNDPTGYLIEVVYWKHGEPRFDR